VHPGDRTLLADIGDGQPTASPSTKSIASPQKDRLLPLLAELSQLRDFCRIVPFRPWPGTASDRLLDETSSFLRSPLPLRPDTVTDRPLRFFAAELVRGSILAPRGRDSARRPVEMKLRRPCHDGRIGPPSTSSAKPKGHPSSVGAAKS